MPYGQTLHVMRYLSMVILGGILLWGFCSCGTDKRWHSVDITGTLPALKFTMTRASDDKTITADEYKGKVVLLYFGYTFCPDICPLTLANLSLAIEHLGQKAEDVRLLFVTVDPDRDTLSILKEYVDAIGPEVVGLRGSQDQIATLAKRYRVRYAVIPPSNDRRYTVVHSSAIYVFDDTSEVRLIVPSMTAAQEDIDGLASDLRKLLEHKNPPSLLQKLLQLI